MSTPSPVNLSSLATLIATGREDAEGILIETLLPGLRFLVSRTVARQDADVIAHQTLQKVIQQIKNGSIPESVSLLSHLRSLMNRMVAAFIAQKVDAGLSVTPVFTGEPASADSYAFGLFAALPEREKQALYLFYVEGLDVVSCCERADICLESFTTLKTTIREAYRRSSIPERFGPVSATSGVGTRKSSGDSTAQVAC